MADFKYLTKEDICELHTDILEEVGGTPGIREEGGIDKLVEFVQNDWYYPTLEDKLTYIIYGLCTGHYFYDVNKRISIVAGRQFLIINKKHWLSMRFLDFFQAYAWHIAAGNIDKDLFSRIVGCYVHHREMDESLRLDLLHAMSKSPLYDENNEV